jgi:hypothetical protein
MIQSLATALSLDEKTAFRMLDLVQRVTAYNVNAWGEDFLKFRDA